MNLRLLIDGILRQTTVLVAQLATTSGVRSPLAQIADQVFLQLTYELENQGVSRAVAADMFGMALRAYQKKIARLSESESSQGQTLWQAVYAFVNEETPTRRRISERFQRDGEREVASVLHDLVSSGMLFTTGEGPNAVYVVTPEHLRKRVFDSSDRDALVHIVWWRVFEGQNSVDQLVDAVGVDSSQIVDALAELERSGQVVTRDGQFYSRNLYIPVGASLGAEAAMLSHFRAVCQLMVERSRSFYEPPDALDDEPYQRDVAPLTGGSTFFMTVYPGHPHEREVAVLLERVRADVQQLSDKVSEHNRQQVVPESARRVTFYCGQVATPIATDGADD